MKKEEITRLIADQGVLPLYFNKDKDVSVAILRKLYEVGIRTVEYTNRGEEALENFKEMKRICKEELDGMVLGVGTIKSKASAEKYIDASADYIICPGVVDEVIEVCQSHDLLCIPGCMTPSEIIHVENLGVRTVKLFPGNLLKPAFLKSVKSVFPDISFMPTGGVSLDRENIKEWFDAGVVAVGMGSKLVSKQLMEEKNYEEIGRLTRRAMEIVGEIKNNQ